MAWSWVLRSGYWGCVYPAGTTTGRGQMPPKLRNQFPTVLHDPKCDLGCAFGAAWETLEGHVRALPEA